jgi:tripartite-type tricarboxylate transporter receptor subunit TctC
MRKQHRRAALGALAALVAAGFGPASAEDFYKGRTINLIVGNTAGGGYDANTRLLARHLGRHIPGNPDIVVQNLPGAASLTSVQYVDASAPKDGTAIVDFNFGLITESKMNPTKIKVDFTKFAWIGSISQDLSVCFVWRPVGIKTLADAQKYPKELHFGLTAVGSSSDVNAHITKSIFKVPIHQVSGYPGSAEQKLAIERGELDGACGAWSSTPPDWIRNDSIVSLLKFAPVSGYDLPPEVPFAADVAPSKQDADVINLLTAPTQVGRPFIASQQVPADRVEILRRAFDATMKDPGFLADAEKQRLPVSPKTGEECLQTIKEIYALPEAVVAAAKKVLEN